MSERYRRRLRRARERRHLRRSVRHDDAYSGEPVPDRPRRRSSSASVRPPRVRLRRLDERDRRRDRMVGRQRHGRHQHVARLVLRAERRPVCGRGGQRSAGRHRRRDLGRQLRSSPYITGSPGTGTHVVSTAANESLSGFPGFTLTLPTAPSPITAINANGEPDVAERDAVHDRLGQRQSGDDGRRRVARLQRVGLSDAAERDLDGGDHPWCVRTRRQGHSEPAGRLRGGGDGEQRHLAASVRRADLLPPGHGRAVHGHDPVHRRSRAWRRRRPRTAPGSVPRPAR